MKQLILTIFLSFTSMMLSFGQDTYLEQGNIFLSNKQFDKAENTFRKAIKSDKSNLIYQNQLALTLIQQKKYSEAESVLDKILQKDSNNVAAIWYSGIGNFKGGHDRQAILRFEKALTLFDKGSGQYFGANWFIGKSYSVLLKTEGLTYSETDRLFSSFEEYLRLQPNAEDADQIRKYVERKKKRRPPNNVLNWIDM